MEGLVTHDTDTGERQKLAWKKPRRSVCGYLKGNKCGIYSKKPSACTLFKCLWLDGELKEDQRPDKIGVIFWRETFEFNSMKETPLVAEEAWPGASKTQEFNKICGAVSQHEPLIVYRRGPSRTILRKDTLPQTYMDMTDDGFRDSKSVPYETIFDEQVDLGYRRPDGTWIRKDLIE